MSEYKKSSRIIYKCDHHIVRVPKYRFRILKGAMKTSVEQALHMLCEWKQCEIQELNVQEGHIHLLVSIPPKVSVSKLMGTLKGKLAIKFFRSYPRSRQKPYWGNHLWARGCFVSTVGLDEDMIRKYVKYQEEEERKIEDDQQKFKF